MSLDRMWRLLDALGNPQNHLPPTIHISGTNGKGSTLAMLKSILEENGAQVHTYTSPHLVNFHERIRLNGHDIAEKLLAETLAEVEQINNGEPITFFEATTAAAFLAFSRHPADYLLLEVGLGGRLDATNVIDAPLLSIITPVSMDHEQFLGSDIGTIAAEKAGILKQSVSGMPAIISQQDEEAREVIMEHATKCNLLVSCYGQDWMAFAEHGRLVVQHPDGLMDLPMPGLVGAHQIVNAGTAVMAAYHLGIPELVIGKGLQEPDWPARLQKLTTGKLVDMAGGEVWLDGGHNQAAAEALAVWISEYFSSTDKAVTLICGLMATKHAENWLKSYSESCVELHCITIPEQPNSYTANDLADQAQG
ncbi:MAG: bifunctional folylpolyglutamate synthase/dihydrofolate synthase, partial [Candidatus Micropelagos sp.]|nr:bifunctional folylpolyglutamate synthase/dihydrofolate synthase [Candidatus Micropelagos sp.]